MRWHFRKAATDRDLYIQPFLLLCTLKEGHSAKHPGFWGLPMILA